MGENLFTKLLMSGRITFDEDRLKILDAFQIIFPISTFLKLRQILLEKNESSAVLILKELGRYQVVQALHRYKKNLNLDKISKEKTIEFMIQHSALMGFGKISFINFDIKPLNIIINDINNPLAIEYKVLYGISKKPIDEYFAGLLEGLYSEILQKNIECKETLCIAKGDKVCQFEIMEKKSKKSKN